MAFSLSIDPHIERKNLIKRLGGIKGRTFSRSLRVKVQNGTRTLYRLMNPRVIFIEERVKRVEGGRVYLQGGMTLISPKLSCALRDSEDLICFLTTIGGEIDFEINRMMRRGRLSEAFIMDALGSVAVESLAKQFHGRMEREYRKKDKAVTLRFSPGYCDWPVEEQKTLFELFDSRTAGIELKDSCLIVPRKSISAVFGVYPVNGIPPPSPYNPCIDCSKIDCPARRA